ncbi:MAG: RMD1 family protein, partial [Planctomycetota bacterium]
MSSPSDPVPTAASKAILLPREGERGFQVQAVLVGTGIDIKRLGATDRSLGAPLVVELLGSLTGGGIAILYGHGAAVFFDASSAAITEYLRQIGPEVRQPFPLQDRDFETLEVRVEQGAKEAVTGNMLVLSDVTVGKLQVIADILAKSVALAHHERAIERQFERIEPFAVNLDHWRRAGRTAHELLQHLGEALLTEHRVVGGARIDDAPELLWDEPELERLWA